MKEALLIVLLIIAVLQDLRSGVISNRLIAAGLVSGLVIHIIEYQGLGILFYLRNISVPVILLYLLFQMRVLGAGDIKLFSMIGSLLTIQELGRCMMYGFAAGGVMAGLCLAADHRRWKRLRYGAAYLVDLVKHRQIRPYEPPKYLEGVWFPFSVPILAGVITALCIPVG